MADGRDLRILRRQTKQPTPRMRPVMEMREIAQGARTSTCFVGWAVGWAVGSAVGCGDGVGVGRGEGLGVGRGEGRGVGWLVG